MKVDKNWEEKISKKDQNIEKRCKNIWTWMKMNDDWWKQINIQGVSKKRYFLGFRLVSVLEVGFYFIACVLESEFWALFIYPLKYNHFRIISSLRTQKNTCADMIFVPAGGLDYTLYWCWGRLSLQKDCSNMHFAMLAQQRYFDSSCLVANIDKSQNTDCATALSTYNL